MDRKLLLLIFLIMRYSLAGIVIQAVFLQAILASNSEAQKAVNVHEAVVNLHVTNIPLIEAFTAIENQTDYSFAFEKKDINPDVRISFKANNQSVAYVLTEISKVSHLRFKQVNNNIHVSKIMRKKAPVVIVEETAQTRAVNGKVTSLEDGSPLPAVNVVEKGTTNGTITDTDGNYSFKVSENATLVFSSVGFIAEEVELDGRSVIDIVLAPDIKQLQELIVVGYGAQEKRDLTGAVASVNTERIEGVSAANLVSALQGAVSGVSINTSFGTPGGGSNILIRGLNSINASNAPLIVVDGIPGASINDIHPGQIESIDVLKDAASTSIYGSRGTNGVIIVTTKSGSPGKLSLSYDGYYAISEPLKKVDILSPDQYVAKRREMYRMQNNLSFDQAQNVGVDELFGSK